MFGEGNRGSGNRFVTIKGKLKENVIISGTSWSIKSNRNRIRASCVQVCSKKATFLYVAKKPLEGLKVVHICLI